MCEAIREGIQFEVTII